MKSPADRKITQQNDSDEPPKNPERPSSLNAERLAYTEQRTQSPTEAVVFVAPNGQRHDTGLCERNLNLLAHAQAIELDIGSQCGGHGVCGGDKVRPACAPDQLSPPTEAEKKHLTPAQLQEGWRLGCQCYPQKTGQFIQVSFTQE